VKRLMLCLIALVALMGASLRAQGTTDITGNWQGTLTPPAGKELRIIMALAKDDGRLKATMYSIDQGGQPIKANSASLDGTSFKFAIDMIGGTYDGKLSADGKTITGTWTQGATPLPFNLVRATKETAWEIPAPPPPPKLMPADADPSFDVATIKPNDTGATRMQGLNVRGRNFSTRASSLADLIGFAYDVQLKQISGGPDWMDKDRYDIAAVPDIEGVPNGQQLKNMIRKLLTDRFKLTFHKEKKEFSAFVLSVGKDGPKLTPSESKNPLPGLGFGPGKGGLGCRVNNGTMGEFTSFLQELVLDRPVVDQTGLTGRYDFNFVFTPDDSQFNGHAPQLPKQADDADTAPSLFEALQQTLGLKLEAKKAMVDVIAIDHVEKPSAN
jgi:uncharacterized protein (TIGR03435 family)